MKSLHRTVVGGGIGVLAMAGVASSVAFACTSQARLSGPGSAQTLTGAPGATVIVEARGFAIPNSEARDVDGQPANHFAGYSNPVFTWNGANGVVLGVGGDPAVTVSTSGTSSGTWTMQLQIPPNATPSPDPYYITGRQTNAQGEAYMSGAVQVYVTGEAPAPSVPDPGPSAPAPALESTPAPAPTAGAPTPAPSATPSAPAAAPATGRPAPASVPSASAPTAAPSSAAPSSALGTPAPAIPAAAVPAGAPATPVDPTKPVPVPAANELWSGLNSSTSASSLLDAPVPATSGSGFPAGAVLLGMGVLALAGTAAVATQRRLAVAKAVRR